VRTRTIKLNQSRVQQFMDCPRKFFWQYEQNLVPHRPGRNLEIGSGVHAGLAVLGAGGTLQQAHAASLVELKKRFPTRRLPGDAELEQEIVAETERMLTAYVQHWGPRGLWAPLGVEVAGQVTVGTVLARSQVDGEQTRYQVELVFKLDNLALWLNNLWLVDYKTASRNDPRDMQKYAMDLQFTAYVYGATQVLQRRVAGIIADFLIKTKVPQFTRERFIRTDEELVEFQHEFCEWGLAIDSLRERVAAGEDAKHLFRKNTKECFRYGTCPFRELCLHDNPETRDAYDARTPDYVDDPKQLEAPDPVAGDVAPDTGRPGGEDREHPRTDSPE
jgi:hypothetical protein